MYIQNKQIVQRNEWVNLVNMSVTLVHRKKLTSQEAAPSMQSSQGPHMARVTSSRTVMIDM